MKKPLASVVIPTFNRLEYLRKTLHTLGKQTLPADSFEVVVVDDGSAVSLDSIKREVFPFRLHCCRQATNKGDAAARNLGAEISRGRLLVFLDDDVLVHSDYLRCLVEAHSPEGRRIMVGTQYLWLEPSLPEGLSVPVSQRENETVEIDFADVCSNNMSVTRECYFSVGMMQCLGFGGSSIWCDVDFCYRAYRKGFRFFRRTGAVSWHQDYVLKSLESQKRRTEESAYRAVRLFQKYPGLLPHLPMFADKTPVEWRQDSNTLKARKILRRLASTGPALFGMESTRLLLERVAGPNALARSLSRWIVGGHMFKGYRRGLHDLYESESST